MQIVALVRAVSARNRVMWPIAALQALGASPVLAQGGPPPQLVVVDAAVTRELAQLRSVTGEVRSLQRALVAAQVEGVVEALDLNEGDAVEHGQVIARLDDEIARLDVEEARALVEAAEGSRQEAAANLDRARRDLDRVAEAQRRGSVSESELDAAQTEVSTREALLRQAAARVASATADLGRRERALKDMTIVAPFSGRIVAKTSEIGEWVTPGDTLVEVVSLDRLEARIDVPEAFLRFLDADRGPLSVSVPALGETVEVSGTLLGVIPSADTLSRLFPVRLSLEAGSGVLRPGMSLTAFVPTGNAAPTLTVHKDAILRDDGGEFVYMAVPFTSESNPGINGRAIPARIARLYAVGNRVAIRPGQVQDGSLLLVQGNERVFPTQPLIITNPPPGSPFAGGAAGGGAQAAGDR